MTDELLDQLRSAAEQDRRSINQEIVWLLEQALTRRGNQK